MTDITPERLAEIKARAEAATAGPWSWESSIYEHMEAEIVAKRGLAQLWKSGNVIPDAAFIAAARQDIPDLIAALEAAQAENAKLRADMDISYGLAREIAKEVSAIEMKLICAEEQRP